MNSTINCTLEEKLFSLPGRGGKTFEAMQKADAKIGSPHKAFKSIHIAGTNGKGSVATKIAAALEFQGYKVGLYTSPHIWSFHERIQINGEVIEGEVAAKLFTQVFDPSLSFFDVLTLMAFLYFKENQIDYAVIETGLGGKFDATNVITPILSIITSIGFDHMSILGNTLEKIAEQKSGIIKPNIPVIVGPTALPFFPQALSVQKEPLFELENRALAKLALQKLGITSENGLDTQAPLRFYKHGNLLLDPAHNVTAFDRLVEALKYHYPGQKHSFFLAFSKEKDWVSCIQAISPVASSIKMIRSPNPLLMKKYPGFEMVEPNQIERGVVAGSFYVLSEFFNPEIQSTLGAFSRLSHL